MTDYPHEDRARARAAAQRLDAIAEKVKSASRDNKPLSADLVRAVATMTNTEDRQHWPVLLASAAEHIRNAHMERLASIGHDDFAAFCEYTDPTEPPESPWHIYLCNLLEQYEKDKLFFEDGLTRVSNLLLNTAPGHAKPLHADTRTLMGDGSYKRLGDVEIGDLVITHTGRPQRVTAVHEQGLLPLVRVVTENGREVRSALDHPFLVDGNRYVNAGDLRPGMRLSTVAHTILVQPTPLWDEDIALFRFAAFVASTGTALKSPRKTGHSKPPVVLRLFSSWEPSVRQAEADAEILGLDLAVYDHRSQEGFAMNCSADTRDKLARHMDVYAMSPDRRVPGFVFRGADQKVAAYLSTAFSARAECLRRLKAANLRLYHKSHGWLEDLQSLLARFDVQAKLTRVENGHGRPFLHLDEDAVGRFIAAGLTYDGRGAELLRTHLRHLSGHIAWAGADHVARVVLDGEGPCRCLTVETDHTFTANDLVVHNSTYASRKFVAWRMGRNPSLKVIGGGHTQTFVEKEFSKKIRDIVGSPEFKRIFPNIAIDASSRANDAWNLAGEKGQYVARGAGQAVHGFRANFTVIDDPYPNYAAAESPTYRKTVETWVLGDIGTRLLPDSKQLVVMTRFHSEDLTNKLLELNKELPLESQFYHIAVPAICYDPETDVMKRAFGEVLWKFFKLSQFTAERVKNGYQKFALTYQQLTSATNPDSIASQFKYFTTLPYLTPEALKAAPIDVETGRPVPQRQDYIKRTAISVDCAAKTTDRADYTVVQCWMETQNKTHLLVDQYRGKVEFNDMVSKIEQMARKWNADVILVEDKGQGTAYVQARGSTDYQRRLAPCPVVPIKVNSNQGKQFRFDAAAPMIEAGEVYLSENATWVDILVVEVGQFPEGSHDDQVDAMSQYLNWARSKRRKHGSRKVHSFG